MFIKRDPKRQGLCLWHCRELTVIWEVRCDAAATMKTASYIRAALVCKNNVGSRVSCHAIISSVLLYVPYAGSSSSTVVFLECNLKECSATYSTTTTIMSLLSLLSMSLLPSAFYIGGTIREQLGQLLLFPFKFGNKRLQRNLFFTFLHGVKWLMNFLWHLWTCRSTLCD